jgi:hypothetical protein
MSMMPTFSIPGNLRVDDADVSELLECSSPDSATELALDAFARLCHVPSSEETLDKGLFFFANEDLLLMF